MGKQMELISELEVILVSGGLRCDIDDSGETAYDYGYYVEPQPGLPGLACICF